jgi:glutathione S-transferase
MKLFYVPGACSLATHIALREAGLDFQLDKLDPKTKRTSDGRDYNALNPKSYVPALELDDGQVLTEGAAIQLWVADQKPQAKLAPAHGTMARYRLEEWMVFIATEVHKGFSPLFRPVNEEHKQASLSRLSTRLDFLEKHLQGRAYLMDTFTVADGYLFTVLRWSPRTGLDLAKWPALKALVERVSERPAVKAALEAESR